MTRRFRLAAAAGLVLAAACADQEAPTSAEPPGAATDAPGVASNRAEAGRAEQVARRLALALRDPALRAELNTALQLSPVAEHKLHFQRYLAEGSGRRAARIAAATGGSAEDVTAEALGAVPLEVYLPVPAHREAWNGGESLLVATAISEHEAPVAFDLDGRRHLLDPAVPPATPVLALVPVETDFDAPPPDRRSNAECQDCGGDGGLGQVLQANGVVMTYASFVEDFEGWLKGAPEFEIHIMGPNSAADTATAKTFQCIGEQAPYAYRWNMDKLEWTGSIQLFSNAQLAAFEQTYPGRAFLILALEDDDGPCVIRANRDLAGQMLEALGQAYADYKGAKDQKVLTPGGLARILRAGRSGFSVITSLASLLKTNDELIGFAIADSISGRYHPLSNWTVQDTDLNAAGRLRLEIR